MSVYSCWEMFVSWGLGEGWWSLRALLKRWPLRGGVHLPKSVQAHGSAPETARES